MAKVVVIIPTYNEVENTKKMIDTLSDVFAQIKDHDMHLLYVDGNSPDGTADVVKEKQKKYKWLHLLIETKKEGLGMAYAKGMTHAMEKLKADWLMEFDADFQHPPEDLPRLVAEINNGYDYILGSRYIKGGSIPKTWGFSRKFLSVVGNIVARITLIMPQIHDVTGGFKLSRVKGFMDGFDFSTLLSKSFAYKIHLLFYMVKKGAKVKEVPFHFKSRNAGESKIIKNEMIETLRVIFLLQYNNPSMRRFFKFLVVGGIGFLINFGFLRIFRSMGLPEVLVWALATEMAVISNFTLNNVWTFKSEKIGGIGHLFYKFLQFNLTSLGAIIITAVAGSIGVHLLGPEYDFIILVFTVGFLVVPYNYFMYNFFIWRTWRKGKK